jgi:hypothetical protein
MNIVKHMLYCHKFFFEESKSYMKGVPRLQYYRKLPKAYFIFMKSMINDRTVYNRNKNYKKDLRNKKLSRIL